MDSIFKLERTGKKLSLSKDKSPKLPFTLKDQTPTLTYQRKSWVRWEN